jgi:hypothetical protein
VTQGELCPMELAQIHSYKEYVKALDLAFYLVESFNTLSYTKLWNPQESKNFHMKGIQ